jgi:hypothetical protein
MKNGLFLALTLLCSASVMAENRAKVEHMTVNLKLPDNSNLTVDMNFDCGSYYNKTAMIVTSRQGAEILATAYEALYGPAAGKAVMDKWNKKAKAEDPRLPTFIVVKPPEGKSYLLNTANKKSAPLLMKSDNQEQPKAQSFNAAEISPSCGGVDHPNY